MVKVVDVITDQLYHYVTDKQAHSSGLRLTLKNDISFTL